MKTSLSTESFLSSRRRNTGARINERRKKKYTRPRKGVNDKRKMRRVVGNKRVGTGNI